MCVVSVVNTVYLTIALTVLSFSCNLICNMLMYFTVMGHCYVRSYLPKADNSNIFKAKKVKNNDQRCVGTVVILVCIWSFNSEGPEGFGGFGDSLS